MRPAVMLALVAAVAATVTTGLVAGGCSKKKTPKPAEQQVALPIKGAPAGASDAAPARVAEALPPPKTLRLSVRSTPTGAEFTMDGKPMGQTPVSFEVEADNKDHEFSFRKDGYQPATYRTTPVRDGLLAHIQLKRLPPDAGPPE